MLIKYLGELSKETRSYGCSKCGTSRSVNGKEVYKTQYRTYFDGRLIIFKKDTPVEVDNTLGNFLLSRQYRDNTGVMRNSFVEVEVPPVEEVADDNVPTEEPVEEVPSE